MPIKRASLKERKRNEAEIHKKSWHTRWAKYGRHIETPLAQIKDPKERASREEELRNELISAETEIEKFRAEHYQGRGVRVPKGVNVEDLPSGPSEGEHQVSETEMRASLMQDLPFFATHGHFSDELKEGVTSSKKRSSKTDEELGGLRVGSFRDVFSRLSPAEQANFRARANQYREYEKRVRKLGSRAMGTEDVISGFKNEQDRERADHLYHAMQRRKLTKAEQTEVEQLATSVTKERKRPVEPSDIPYLSENRAPDVKRNLRKLLKDADKTQHARLNRFETERKIEMSVRHELGAHFSDPAKKADKDALVKAITEANFGMHPNDRMQLLAHTAHEMEQHYVRAMLPQATPEDRRRFKQTQQRYKAIKEGKGGFSQEAVKTTARLNAHELMSRLGVESERAVESDRQTHEIINSLTTAEKQAIQRGKQKGLTDKQRADVNLGIHQWALEQGLPSPAVLDLTKAKGRTPTHKELAKHLGVTTDELTKREATHRPRTKFTDERMLGRRTVEDAYRMSGHAEAPLFQGWLRRSMTDEDTKKFRQGKAAKRTGPIQLIPPTLKTQWAFHAQQRRNQIHGLTSGEAAWGWGDKGSIPITHRNIDRVAFGMIPNRQFNYELRNRELTQAGERKAPIKLQVPGYDLRPLSELAPGNVYSEDDLAAPPQETRLQTEKFRYTRGQREPIDPRKRSRTPFVSETIYVPIAGATGQTHTAPDENRGMEQGYFALSSRPSGPREGSGWDVSRRTRVTQDVYNTLAKDAREQDMVGKTVQHVFLDPSMLTLKDKQINKASLAVNPKKARFGDRLAFTNLPMQDTRRDKIVGPYLEARAQRQYEEKAQSARQTMAYLNAFPPPGTTESLDPGHLQQGGFAHQSELELLAAAAGASAFYKLQKSAKKGVLHKTFEKGAGAVQRTSLYKKNEKRYSLPKFKSDIERAYIQPGDAFLLNKAEQIKHPLSSQTSDTIGGLDIKTPYFRSTFIKPETRELRQIQRESNRLHNIVRAQDYGLDHLNDRGILGPWRRYKARGFMRHNIVKNFNRLEDPEQGVTSTLGEATRFARMYKDNDFVQATHPANHSGETFHVTGSMKSAAGGLLQDIEHLREHSYVRQGLGVTPHAPAGPHLPSRWAHGDFTHTEQTMLIGGAVAATALGAAYLYHRHQEKKKAEEDRVAFYNKALPPAFNIPVPQVHANAWLNTGNNAVMREIPGAANRRIPVRFGLSKGHKRIAIRPMDRKEELGTKYAANLPLVGGLRVGLRPRGGSVKKSLTTDLQHPLSRQFKQGSHELKVAGRRIPITIEAQKKVALSRTNPANFGNKQREDIIAAASGTPDEAAIKRFYSYGKVDPIIEMWNDPEEVNRIRIQKGKPELQKIAMQQFARAQGPQPRARRRERARMGQTGRYY